MGSAGSARAWLTLLTRSQRVFRSSGGSASSDPSSASTERSAEGSETRAGAAAAAGASTLAMPSNEVALFGVLRGQVSRSCTNFSKHKVTCRSWASTRCKSACVGAFCNFSCASALAWSAARAAASATSRTSVKRNSTASVKWPRLSSALALAAATSSTAWSFTSDSAAGNALRSACAAASSWAKSSRTTSKREPCDSARRRRDSMSSATQLGISTDGGGAAWMSSTRFHRSCTCIRRCSRSSKRPWAKCWPLSSIADKISRQCSTSEACKALFASSIS
mmetsp:Transcript_160342/g.514519  ORF Transcript_160342/g.514519 Transcript_160342/m.514519 type:complete len:279 (+) Transcript_160342:686-1522(+)